MESIKDLEQQREAMLKQARALMEKAELTKRRIDSLADEEEDEDEFEDSWENSWEDSGC